VVVRNPRVVRDLGRSHGLRWYRRHVPSFCSCCEECEAVPPLPAPSRPSKMMQTPSG
jgi:hypothetical protein